MNKILIVKTLFCPNLSCFNSTFDSTKDLISFISNNNINDKYEIDILLIGWMNKDIYSNNIQKLINLKTKYFTNINYVRLPINFGKYFIFKFINKYFNDQIYLLFLDHDIFFDSLTSSVFDIIKHIYNNNNLDIGIIALNQKEDLRHQISALDKCIKINNNELGYNNNFTSIALGCFFIKNDCKSIFDNLELLCVYGLDDYHIQHKLNNIKYKTVLMKDVYITHPYDNDIKYKLWKVQMVEQLITTNLNYYRTVEESINFWNK